MFKIKNHKVFLGLLLFCFIFLGKQIFKKNLLDTIPISHFINNNSMWVDTCNGISQPYNQKITFDYTCCEDELILQGWAADMVNMQPLEELYLQVGKKIYKCDYGISRESVVNYYQQESLRYTGFSVSIPIKSFKNGNIKEIQFIQVIQNGIAKYEPITYSITYNGIATNNKDHENILPITVATIFILSSFVLLVVLILKSRKSIHKFKQNKFLFTELVKRDFTLKYKRTILGIFWSVLSPLINLLIMWVVFNKLLGSNIEHFVIYLFAGQLIFTYFCDSTNLGMTSLLDNAGIFTKVNVPKYLFLLSRNVSALINFILTLIIFFVFVALDGITFSFKFFTLLYPIICLIILNIGIGMILSALFMFFRDVQYLWGLATQLIMWVSAIFYSIDVFSESLQKLFLLNPIYLCIRYFRKIVIDGVIPSLEFHLLLATFSIGFLIIGCFIYKKKNHEFLYYI